MSSTQEQVRVLLDLAGIEPTPAEFEQMVVGFPDVRTRVERLWALDLGDAAPAMVFRAAESFGPAEVAR